MECIGPEHSEWLLESEAINATEVVQDYLDTVGPQDRPAAGLGRPAQSDPSQSAEVISDCADAQAVLPKARREGAPESRVQIGSQRWFC